MGSDLEEIRWLVRTEVRFIPKYTYEFLCEQTVNPLSYERTNGELKVVPRLL